MEKIRIEYKGIVRSVSGQQVLDGSLDELINLRHRNERLQPVGHPTKLYELPTGSFSKMWYHDQDGIQNYIGMDTTLALYHMDMDMGTLVLIKQYSAIARVEFLKRFMIVYFGSTMDVFMFNDEGVYELVEITQEPVFHLRTTDEELYSTYDANVEVSTAEGLLGQYFKTLTNISKDNRFTGGLFFRAAYRLYDGSYVFHTLPKILTIANMDITIFRSNIGTSAYTELYSAKAKIFINSDYYTNEFLRDIIDSVVIFACKFETLIEVSEKTITEDNLSAPYTGWIRNSGQEQLLNEVLPFFDDFKDMIKSPSWYKVGEYSFDDLLEGNDVSETIDLEDFYHDFAVRETMPVNNFTQHRISAKDVYNYNSRLVLTNTIQTLFEKEHPPVFKYNEGDEDFEILQSFKYFLDDIDYIKREYDVDIALVFHIKTSSGTKKVVVRQTVPLYSASDDSNNKALAFQIIGYPDSRAKSVEIYHVNDVNSYSLIKTLKLISNPAMNYSYYNRNRFSTITLKYLSGNILSDDYNFNAVFIEFNLNQLVPGNLPLEDKIIYDANRVQVSELANPFVFPAENSYQAGTGEGIASRANTEPLSTGQFGEYPLIIFTTKGTWTLLQGQGDVLFSSIKPLNGEVPLNVDQIVSIGTGVVYSTARGLFFISGSNVQDLSKVLYGLPNLDIQSVDNFKLRINHTSLVQLPNSLSIVNAKLYMVAAKFGFNKQNNELLATNSNYDYSYVYNFESRNWHKVSSSFSILINAYPELQAVRSGSSNDGVFNLSDENFDTTIQTIVVSRPCKINNQVDFVLLHRAIQRCEIETGTSKFAGFYIFGSNDLTTWQMFQGSDTKTGKVTDIFCNRSHLKAKYFVFVLAAAMKEGSAINTLDLQYYQKLTQKIR